MSDSEFPELPGWRFTTEEMSAGVYRVRGVDLAGRSVEKTGIDPQMTLEWCRQAAIDIMARGL
jgi:hypothetical protein